MRRRSTIDRGWLNPSAYDALASRAYAGGAKLVSAHRLEWNVAGNCVQDLEFWYHTGGKLDRYKPRTGTWADIETGYVLDRKPPSRDKFAKFFPDLEKPDGRRFLIITVPCRKCAPCLRARAHLWRSRATMELKLAPRTWFGTFTVRPEARVMFLIRASQKQGKYISCLKDGEDFRAVAAEVSIELTKYLKRIRKNYGKFRYLLVAERHKDGFPHWHILVHEKLTPLLKRQLEIQWTYGFTSWKLCDVEAAKYITKYLLKDAKARVRASLHYGEFAL